jgi:hypothetical protein
VAEDLLGQGAGDILHALAMEEATTS